MNLDILQARFCSYINEVGNLKNIKPFLLVYIRLLLLFEEVISPEELEVILQRRNQILGFSFNSERFYWLLELSRREMNRNKAIGEEKQALIYRLIFCAMLDGEETDFFYLTEPMFDFVRRMNVSFECLKSLLEAEFSDFKLTG